MDQQPTEKVSSKGEVVEDQATDEAKESKEKASKAKDTHAMLSFLLERFVKLQRTGMIWDLVVDDVMYKNCELIFYVSFVKTDTEEADLLCGKYLCRSLQVEHVR